MTSRELLILADELAAHARSTAAQERLVRQKAKLAAKREAIAATVRGTRGQAGQVFVAQRAAS